MKFYLATADPIQAAIFLIALRMKRETDEENLGILQSIQSVTAQASAKVDDLLVLSDPFNGYNRHCPLAVFLPAVLAASGLPTVTQGVKEMGPKIWCNTLTGFRIRRASNVAFDSTGH